MDPTEHFLRCRQRSYMELFLILGQLGETQSCQVEVPNAKAICPSVGEKMQRFLYCVGFD